MSKINDINSRPLEIYYEMIEHPELYKRFFDEPPKEIHDWADLEGMENDKYYLDIKVTRGNGWIRKKHKDISTPDVYLSTHTFYDGYNEWASDLLQFFGFNVKLDNWG